MSTEGQIPDDSEATPGNASAPQAPSGDPRTDDAGADGGFATDDAFSAERLDPELSVAPDTIDLSEPDLAPAEISPEVADAASLEAAAAEARAVAAEAEEASSLVGGPLPRNAPVARVSHDGTAPAGAVVRDTEKNFNPGSREQTGSVALTEDAATVEAPAEPEKRSVEIGRTAGSAAAARPAHSDKSADTPPSEPQTRSNIVPLLLIIGAVVVLVGLLIWLVASLVSGLGSADAAAQHHPAPASVLAHG